MCAMTQKLRITAGSVRSGSSGRRLGCTACPSGSAKGWNVSYTVCAEPVTSNSHEAWVSGAPAQICRRQWSHAGRARADQAAAWSPARRWKWHASPPLGPRIGRGPVKGCAHASRATRAVLETGPSPVAPPVLDETLTLGARALGARGPVVAAAAKRYFRAAAVRKRRSVVVAARRRRHARHARAGCGHAG
jgi:hypothetical protein